MTAMAPALTDLDRAVLHAVPDRGTVRVGAIVYDLRRHASCDEIRGILRGLEHWGLVAQRNGWWRRTA